MPDFGQRSPVDLSIGGFTQLDSDRLRQKQEAEKKETANRLLHPANEKYIRLIMSGQMGPVEAAVAAHAEHDALGTPHVNMPSSSPQGGGMQGAPSAEPLPDHMMAPASEGGYGLPEPQLAPSGMQGRGGMVSAAPSYGTQGNGMALGGMQRPTDRPFTAQDAQDFAGIDKSQRFDPARTQEVKNRGADTVQTSKNAGALDRVKERNKQKQTELEQHSADFQDKMDLEYAKLDQAMQRLRESLKSRQSMQTTGRDDKINEAARNRDAKEIMNIRNSIIGLQREKLRAASQRSIDPELALEVDKKIDRLHSQLEDLELAQDFSQKQQGTRQNLPRPPGPAGEVPPRGPPGAAGPPSAPNKQPAQQPVQQNQSVDPGTPDIPTDIPVKEPMGAKIKVRNKKTGQVVELDKAVVQKAQQEFSGFGQLYQIV